MVELIFVVREGEREIKIAYHQGKRRRADGTGLLGEAEYKNVREEG